MHEAERVEPILALKLHRARARALRPGIEAAVISVEMLLKADLYNILIGHGEHALLGLFCGYRHGNGFADTAHGNVGVQRQRAGAYAFVYGNGGDVRVYAVEPFAKAAAASAHRRPLRRHDGPVGA